MQRGQTVSKWWSLVPYTAAAGWWHIRMVQFVHFYGVLGVDRVKKDNHTRGTDIGQAGVSIASRASTVQRRSGILYPSYDGQQVQWPDGFQQEEVTT